MKSVDVLLFEGVDELDFCAPYEILSSCRKVVNGKWTDKPAFHVQTVADTRAVIQCAHGLCILPDKSLAQALISDIVVVPGGPGARREALPVHVKEFLAKAGQSAEVIASVCTGAFILAHADLLEKRKITTHSACREELARVSPKSQMVTGQRVVIDSREPCIMSSSGISSGIDLALAIIARFEGQETATLSAKRIAWPP